MGGGGVSEARQLLESLAKRGLRLRVVDGSVQVQPARLLRDEDRDAIARQKPELLLELGGGNPPEARPPELLRVAALVGTRVRCGEDAGVLIGVFRDRAVIDTGKYLLTVDHREVVAEGRGEMD